MILDVIDPDRTPDLSEFDRGVLTLYSLAVTNRNQLARITGWGPHKIDSTLKRLRKREKEPGEWLIGWQPGRREAYAYTLGPSAIRYAREARREFVGDDDPRTVGAQWRHYLTTNEILVRLLESDLRGELEAWHGTRESGAWFFHETNGLGLDPDTVPHLKPDAVLEVGGETFAIEADMATIPTPRMRARFSKYLTLAELLPSMPDLLFVVPTEQRRRQLAKALNRVVEEAPSPPRVRDGWSVSFLLIGEVIPFLRDWLKLSASESRHIHAL